MNIRDFLFMAVDNGEWMRRAVRCFCYLIRPFGDVDLLNCITLALPLEMTAHPHVHLPTE